MCERLEPRCVLSSVSASEFLLNTYLSGEQSVTGAYAVASSAGGSVAVWQSRGQDLLSTWGVFGQRFDAAGQKVGSEFLVNTGYLLDDQQRPAVAMNSSGSFVVVWDGDGTLGLFPGVYAQRYAADGTPVGAVVEVAGSVALSVGSASVGMDDSGNFVIAFEANDELLSRGIYARRYSSAGSALGSSFVVNPDTNGAQTDPSLSVRSDGSFVVAWAGDGTGDGSGVFARSYTSAGSAVGTETRLNQATFSTQTEPVVRANSAGFTAAWSGNGTGDSSGVFMRRFDTAGSALSSDQRVNVTTTGAQSQPALALDPDGDVVVSWSGNGTGDSAGVFWREYAADLSPRTGERLLNTTTSGTQERPAVASGGDNTYSLVWSGAGSGDSDGTFGATLKNDAPVVTASSGSASFTEDGAAVAIDAGVTISDADSPSLTSATISITGYVAGEDALLFTDQLGITGSWSSATGTLTLAGAATVAAYQTAIRSITYANASQNPTTSARSIAIRVHDGVELGAAGSRGLVVTAINDAPVAATSSGSASFTEDGSAVALDAGITVTDVDSAALSGVTVWFSAGYAISQDALQFTDQLGITGSWSSATGTLTLSGVAAITDYQLALRSITYVNSSQNPSTVARTVSIVVHDGVDPGAAVTRGVAVTAVNDAPVATASGGSASFVEDGSAVALDAGITVTDVDSAMLSGVTVWFSSGYAISQDALQFTDQLGITGSWSSATGTLTLSGVVAITDYQLALRSITYVNSSQNPSTAARTVSIVVHDGVDPGAAVTRGVAVTAVNDAPVATASGGSASFVEDGGAVAVDTAIGVSDVDSSILTSASVRISVGYASAEDELLFTDQLGITGSWDAGTGTLTLTGTASIADYQAALRTVRYINLSQNPGTGARTVSVVVSDGTDVSAAGTRALSVTAVNDAPVATASGGSASFVEDGSAVAVDAGIGVSDVDSSALASATVRISAGYISGEDELQFADQSGITGSWDAGTGTLTLTGTASIADYQAALRTVRYVNLSQNPGTAGRTVSFVVSDGTDASAAGTRSLNVSAINDVPVVVASGGAASFVEDGAGVFVDAGLSIADVDSTSLAGATIQISGGYTSGQDVLVYTDQLGIVGAWDGATGTLTLTGVASLADYQTAVRSIRYLNGSQNPTTTARTISFSAEDGGGASAVVTRSLSVIAVNDAPAIVVSGGAATYTEDGAASVLDAGLTLGDVDSTTLAGASVWISAGYQSGQDSLVFLAQSGITGSWDAGTGLLTLSGVATVVDYQTALRSITYSNASQDPSTATRTISFTVTDGSDGSAPGSRSLAVLGVNDAPVVVTTSGSALFVEDGSAVLVDAGVVLTDVDDVSVDGAVVVIDVGYVPGEDALAFIDQLGITGAWDATSGVLTLNGTASLADYQTAIRAITYVNSSQNPTVAPRGVAVTVNDGSALSAVVSRSIVVVGVNDAPIVTAPMGPATFVEDGPSVSIAPSGTVGDVDTVLLAGATIAIASGFVAGEDALQFTDMLGISGAWDASTGVLTLGGAASAADYQIALRSILYINGSQNPTAGLRGLTITIDDGTDVSTAAACGVSVTAINDAPVVVASAGSAIFLEDGPVLLLDSGITVGDVDSASLQGARVAFASGYEPGEDILLFTDMLGISGSWDAAAGELRLTGGASVASYEAAIRSVTYLNSSQNPSGAPRVLEWSVDDGGSVSAATGMTLIVTSVNDAPAVSTTLGLVAYVENDGPVVLDAGLVIADVDSAMLAWATVRIGSGYSAGDTLSFVDQGGISGSWDAASGVLTLSGAASEADYQQALRSVMFTNGRDDPMAGARSVELIVSDGVDASIAAMRVLDLVVVDDPARLSGSGAAVSYTEGDAPVDLDPLIGMADPDSAEAMGLVARFITGYQSDGDVLLVGETRGLSVTWDAATGTLRVTGAGSISDYIAVLRSLSYESTATLLSPGVREIGLVVMDGSGPSDELSMLLSVFAAPLVDPPDPSDPPDVPDPPDAPDPPESSEPPESPDPSGPPTTPDPSGSPEDPDPPEESDAEPPDFSDGDGDQPVGDGGGDGSDADPFDLSGLPPTARSRSGDGDEGGGTATSSPSEPGPPVSTPSGSSDGKGEGPSSTGGSSEGGGSPPSESGPTTGDSASPTSSSSLGAPFDPPSDNGPAAQPVNEPPAATVRGPDEPALATPDEGLASAPGVAAQEAEPSRGAASVVIVGEPAGVMSSAWDGLENLIDGVTGHRGSQVMLVGVGGLVFAWTSALWLPVGVLGARWSRAATAELQTFDLALLLKAWEKTQGRRSLLISAGAVEEGA